MLAGRICNDTAPNLATVGAIYNDCANRIRSVVDSNGEYHGRSVSFGLPK